MSSELVRAALRGRLSYGYELLIRLRVADERGAATERRPYKLSGEEYCD